MLGERLGLPVWHTDMFFHDPGWTPRPTEALIADLTALAAKPAWVIDGNCANARYGSGIGDRLARADRIIWLDLPRRLTIPAFSGVLRSTAEKSVQTVPQDARNGSTGDFWFIAGAGVERCDQTSLAC